MDGLILVLVLALIAIPLVRWYVWHLRYQEIRADIARIDLRVNAAIDKIREFGAKLDELTTPAGKKKVAVKAAQMAKAAAAAKAAKPAVLGKPVVAVEPEVEAHAVKPVEPSFEEPALEFIRATRGKKEPEIALEPAKEVAHPPMAEEAPTPPIKTRRPAVKEAPPPQPAAPPRETVAKKAGEAVGRLLRAGKGQATDWETLIGGHWLNLVGIVVLVIGIILLTQQTLLYLGPAGKVATGVVVGAALLIAGVLLGRSPAYRLLARTLMGGGWALVYFTAYAAHNVTQARIIESPTLGLGLLCIVAAGIIAHSFTYRSQLLTSLAYGLGFLAVTMSPVTIFSLVASAILAASLVALLRLMPWHHLVMLGVAGTYLNHWRWIAVASTQSGMAGSPTGTQVFSSIDTGFWLSTAILCFYWLLFVIASLVRKPPDATERYVRFTATVLNTIGMLGLVGWQTWQVHHGQLYNLTGPACIAYCAVAYLDYRQRERYLFLFNGTVAAVLYLVTLPLAIHDLDVSADWLALYWAAGGLTALLVGARATELILRIEAYILLALSALAAWQFNLAGEFTARTPIFWIIVPVVIVLLNAVDDWLQRAAGHKDIRAQAGELSWAVALVALVLLARLTWNLVEPAEAGGAWILIGLALIELGLWMKRHLLRAQGYLLLALGSAALLAINLIEANLPRAEPAAEPILPAWQLVLIGVVALYYCAWRLARWSDHASRPEQQILPAFSAAATVLLAGTILKEVDRSFLAASWVILGVCLFEIGWRFRTAYLRIEAYLVMLAASFAAVAVNIFGPVQSAGVPDWVLTGFVALILAYVFTIGRTQARPRLALAAEAAIIDATSFAASLLVALTVWKEVPLIAVAAGWTVLALFLFEAGRRFKIACLRAEAYLALVAAIFATISVHILELVGPVSATILPAWAYSGFVVLGLFYIFAAGQAHLREGEAGAQSRLQAVEFGESSVIEASSYAATLLLSLVLWKELPSVAVAVAWTVVALVLFELSAFYGKPCLRQQSHLVMLAAFGRLFMANFVVPGEAFGISHRLLTVTPVIVAIYYLRQRIVETLRPAKEGPIGWLTLQGIYGARLYSYAAAILIAVLMRFELGRAYAVIGWTAALAVFLWLGRKLDNTDFRIQSYLLGILAFARSASTSVYLVGTYHGISERLVTTVPVILVLFASTFFCPRQTGKEPGAVRSRLERWGLYIDYRSRTMFAVLSSVLVPILIYYQFDTDYISMGWALAGLLMLTIGFVSKERPFRLCGMALLVTTLAKVTLFDLAGVEAIYRIFSFIVLGIVLLLTSLAYTRYRQQLERYL